LERVRQLSVPDEVGSWEVSVHGPARKIAGRLCAIRKTEAATRRAQRKIRRKAQQGGSTTKPETLECAAYVMVFTTLPATSFPAPVVLEWYRGRWQIELAFKRLKTLAKLGHLPDQNEETVRAWLYGKLLIALLGQKIARLGRDISPWGYRQGTLARTESVERVLFRTAPDPASHPSPNAATASHQELERIRVEPQRTAPEAPTTG
jgi:hypothetical protein